MVTVEVVRRRLRAGDAVCGNEMLNTVEPLGPEHVVVVVVGAAGFTRVVRAVDDGWIECATFDRRRGAGLLLRSGELLICSAYWASIL